MKTFQLSESDLDQITQHGLTANIIKQQLHTFRQGTPFVKLVKAANIGEGIRQIGSAQLDQYIEQYEAATCKTTKFIPASGSATRMFKLLHQFLDRFDPEQDELSSFINTADYKALKPFFERINELPFFNIVRSEMEIDAPSYASDFSDQEKYEFVHLLIHKMGYAELPKGLIPFHDYEDKAATAFEEHLYEAAQYAAQNNKAYLHFTIAEEHLKKFKSTFKQIRPKIEALTGIDFKITYSFQEKSTDTIAVNKDNSLFRDKNGKLYFRPGGHGALIENLNEIESDLVFIKNIDNVVPEAQLPLITKYKKTLAGLLLQVQKDVFDLLKKLDQEELTTAIQMEAQNLAKMHFGFTKTFQTAEEIKSFFNRPIRVCGMVKNEGKPGGGPFWIKRDNGELSLQIIESAQIDNADDHQLKIMQEATHFNPVDLVCGLKNYRGEQFDLLNFVNPHQAFITHKTLDGEPLKALELPGLWNGAMAYWNSIFVEVPSETFSPVKTVVDLLNEQHQVRYCD